MQKSNNKTKRATSNNKTERGVFDLPQKISNTGAKATKETSFGKTIAMTIFATIAVLLYINHVMSPKEDNSVQEKLESEQSACENKYGYEWNGSKCVKKPDDISPDDYRKDTDYGSGSNSNSSSTSTSSSSSTKKAYGSDPNNPDTYTGVGESLEDKQIRSHILCKHYAENYFYPDKVSFSSITGVVTDEEQDYGWRYDVMMDVKSSAGGKRSYIMHCIAGGFNTKDYSNGKVTMFKALPR